MYADKLSCGGFFDFSVAAVPVASPQCRGYQADKDLGRGSVNPELRIVAAPP